MVFPSKSVENIVSKRIEHVTTSEDFASKYLYLCNDNEYDKDKNPKGYINLGTAVNNMCHDILFPRLTSKEIWHCDITLLQYRESYGIKSLRTALAAVMTKFFKGHEPVNPDNLICTVGVTSSIDLIAYCIADPGDVILAPTPLYARVLTDLKHRSQVDIWPIPIITDEDSEENQVLTLEKIKKAYSNAISQNKVVKGIFIINPSNPLGDIYNSNLLMEILLFCKEHQLHAIFDEVYALSVFPDSPPFHSILKFPTIPDLERTHVLYGLSKDFGLSGLRIGAIHTENIALQKCLRYLSHFQEIPYPVMGIAAKFLEDLDWCHDYILKNQQRLSEKYKSCISRFKEMGLRFRKSLAGFFIWVNFQAACGLDSFKQERDFFHYLIEKAHLYIIPGEEYFCTEPGWFRVAFSSNPDHVHEGLNRLEKAIKDYKSLELQNRK